MVSARVRQNPDQRRRQLVETVLSLVASRGLDAVSVREVATAAGVSVGAVQHHFRSKDELIRTAFEAVVDATRDRLAAVRLVDDIGTNLETVLAELLPLDADRADEARIYLAFAARAATAPGLQDLQRELLIEIRTELRTVLGPGRQKHAALLIAAVDGMAFQYTSAPGVLTARQMRQTLRLAVAASLA